MSKIVVGLSLYKQYIYIFVNVEKDNVLTSNLRAHIVIKIQSLINHDLSVNNIFRIIIK
jgi:hypothetical protein